MHMLNYEKLVSDFEESLLTQLRGHGSTADYLELWVPDSDPVKSLLNMVDAAQLAGKQSILVTIRQATLDQAGVDQLRTELGTAGSLSVDVDGDSWILKIAMA